MTLTPEEIQEIDTVAMDLDDAGLEIYQVALVLKGLYEFFSLSAVVRHVYMRYVGDTGRDPIEVAEAYVRNYSNRGEDRWL